MNKFIAFEREKLLTARRSVSEGQNTLGKTSHFYHNLPPTQSQAIGEVKLAKKRRRMGRGKERGKERR